MFYTALILILLTAAASFSLSRFISTRILGFIAAGMSGLAALLLLGGSILDVPTPPPMIWAIFDETSITFIPAFDSVQRMLSVLLLSGGSVTLLALALSIAPSVRTFGNLFAWSLIALAAALVGISSSLTLIPFAWASAALAGYSAVRSSRTLRSGTILPWNLALSLLASLVFLVGAQLALPNPAIDQALGPAALMIMLLACLMLAEGAPVHSTLDEIVQAPTALDGLLHSLAFPILAVSAAFSAIKQVGPLPPFVSVGVALLGLLSILTYTIGALREHGLRTFLGWQASAQASLVIVTLAIDTPLATLAAPVLLSNAVLALIAGALAITKLERFTGSDDYTQTRPQTNLVAAGVIWMLAGFAAIGFPPFWGFWGRWWLFEAAYDQRVWLLPPILAANVLTLFAYLAPLGRFWMLIQPATATADSRTRFTLQARLIDPLVVVASLLLLLLLVLGLAPQLAWSWALSALPGAPASLPISGAAYALASAAGVFLLLLLLLLSQRKSARQPFQSAKVEPVVLAPDTLSVSQQALVQPGRPSSVLRWFWSILIVVSRGARLAFALFEQRFYLAGILLGLMLLILSMAQ